MIRCQRIHSITDQILQLVNIPPRDELFIPLSRKVKQEAQTLFQRLPSPSLPTKNEGLDLMLARIIAHDYSISDAHDFVLRVEDGLLPIHIYENLMHSIALRHDWKDLVQYSQWMSNRNIRPSVNFVVVMCQKALESGRLDDFWDYFYFMKQSWWPLSRKTFTYLFASHFDRLMRIQRSKRSMPVREESRTRILESYRRLSRKQRRQGMDFDHGQFGLFTIGLAQSGLLQNAMYKYRHFERLKTSPPQLVVDCLLRSVGSASPERRLKVPQDAANRNCEWLLQFLLEDVRNHGTLPSVETMTWLLHVCKYQKFALDQLILQLALDLYSGDDQDRIIQTHWDLFKPTVPKRVYGKVENRWLWWDSQFQSDVPLNRMVWIPGILRKAV